MTKARSRINDTLAFIQNLALGPGVFPAPGPAQVHSLVQTMVNQRFPPGGNDGANQALIAFSNNMGLGTFYQGNENSADRQRLRAIYLLKAAQAWHLANNTNFAGVPLPRTYLNPQTLLVDELWKARLIWGQRNFVTAPHQDLIAYIRANALVFMASNLLSIAGTQNQALGPGGGQADRNVQNYDFCFDAAQDKFDFRPAGQGPVGSYTLPVVSLRAQHWTEGASRGVVPLPLAPGPDFSDVHGTELGGATMMLTTQFTGCALCLKPAGGLLYAAHVVPGALAGPPPRPTIGGALELAQQLCGLRANVGGVDFANVPGAPAVTVYGQTHSNGGGVLAGGYPVGQMYVLGFDAGAGGWDLYAQYRNNRAFLRAPQKIW